MALPVTFPPSAAIDADEAARGYAERSTRAAVRFLDDLDHLVERIAVSPQQIPAVGR